MKNLMSNQRFVASLFYAIFLAISLCVSPTWAQDEADDDIVLEDTSTVTEEPIEDTSEIYTESDE